MFRLLMSQPRLRSLSITCILFSMAANISGVLPVTLSAAEILGIENRVGSLEVGKEANLVILGENPLKVDKMRIKDVQISARIFRGEKC